MSNGKLFRRLAAIVAVLGLIVAAPAAAYKVPKPPGSPGGPPTKPKGGTGSTKAGATTLGTKLAGFTAGELAKQGTFTVTVKFPAGGTMLGSVTGGGKVIGQGFAGRANKGTEPMGLTFSTRGKAYLESVNGQAVKLTIKLTFVPNNKKKKIQTSTVTITTAK